MDRFALRFSLGYVSPEEEVRILSDRLENNPIDTIQPCIDLNDAIALKAQTRKVRISESIKRYVVDIVNATHSAAGIQLGASPRASLALMKVAQALALFDGYEFVTPEHIQELAVPAIAHRLIIDPQARFSGVTAENIVEEIINSVPVPA